MRLREFSCGLFLISVGFAAASWPRVSIITSVYNGDAFIEGFMKDITQQTIFDQCELIMINANSPGHEEAVIKRYMQRYPNIVYKKLEHDPGIYAVWNMAIAMARAQYITNANLDDRLRYDCYEAHVRALDEHPEADLAYSDFYVTYNPNETFYNSHCHHLRTLPEFSAQALLRQPLPNNHPMWRASMHERYGLFDASYRYAGDWEFWLRVVAGGAIFLKVHGVYGLYYYNPKGLSTNKASPLLEEDLRLHRCYHIILPVEH